MFRIKSKNIIFTISVILVITVTQIGLAQNTNNVLTKKGGICFRTDDNFTKENYERLDSLFSYYNQTYSTNYHFAAALNFAGRYIINGDTTSFNDPDYVSTVLNLQASGHEIMDHTPNHRTNYFITKFDSLDYIDVNTGKPIDGVDTIIAAGNNGTHKICLEFNKAQASDGESIGLCSISGDTLSGDFSSIDSFNEPYVYLSQIDTLLFISGINASKTEAYLLDVWEDSVNFVSAQNIDCYKLDRSGRLSEDGLRVLALETQKLADSLGITRPTTWIQPGGRHPILSMSELYEALTPLGYTAGASFGEVQSLKVFNEYDPNNVKRFGMQWEDFNEDNSTWSIEKVKSVISDGIAKHKVLMGHNHFYTLGTDDYVSNSEYFERVDSILNWCVTDSIDVKTYSEWAYILYNPVNDTYANVFPPLNVNLDDSTNTLNPNGWPDGYYPRTNDAHGEWEIEAGSPGADNYIYKAKGWYSRIFLVQFLGGIEKGEQEFEIWSKGGNHVNNIIDVIISFPYNNNYSSVTFQFPANTDNWTKYNLSQSLTAYNTLNIPDDVSLINIEIKSNTNFDPPIEVTGMKLFKKKPVISTNIKVILEGPYDTLTTQMVIPPAFKDSISLVQPFNTTPWNYDGSESVASIPNDVIDWVLIELRSDSTSSSVVATKAGFVKTDGTVINTDGTNISFEIAEGDYYIVIYHRNHLPIMSATKVPFYNN